jgi:DNA-binding SARP family transcriptional activator
MKLTIKTLGVFDIKIKDTSLIKKGSRTYKINKLLQYFIAFRDRKILPETIIENLFPEDEYADPKNTLSTQIYRLRSLLKSIVPEEEDRDNYLNINSVNGNYILEVGDRVEIDVDEFESLIKKGDQKLAENREEALEIYNKALKIYEGMFLSENAYEVWLTPVRNYYNRLYIKVIFQTIDILKDKENYDKIIRTCEKALNYEPYDEDIHICLMEGMLKQGQFTNVLNHYEYIVNLLKKEMGISSSPKLDKFYKKIKSTISEKKKMTIIDFWNKIELEEPKGAMQCDFSDFKIIVDNQRRKGERSSEDDYIFIITLEEDIEDSFLNSIWRQEITNILSSSLRKGDVFTFWNDRQILILLHEVKQQALMIIEKRFRDKIRLKPKISRLKINIDFKPLIEIEEDKKEATK